VTDWAKIAHWMIGFFGQFLIKITEGAEILDQLISTDKVMN
jgi:hypothetical protein